MIIKLASGKDIVIDDVARDPKVEGIDWLQRYRAKKKLELKARRQAVPDLTHHANGKMKGK